MKNSIKRAQSQACLGFAERKNFRPLAKLKKLSLTLAALLSMTAGAWALPENDVTVTPVTGKTNQWTFTMPAGNVELTPIYAPEFTATFKAGNANTIQGGKATVTVTESGATEGTDVTANIGTDGKLTPLYEGQTITMTAAPGYKFRSVEVKKSAAPRPLTEATAEDIGKVAGADGKIYANVAAAKAASTTACAIIAYVGSETGEASPYTHGLAIAMKDAAAGGTVKWSSSRNDESLTNYTEDTPAVTTAQSGLSNSQTSGFDDVSNYPAFYAALHNTITVSDGISAAAPASGTSGWFLPSLYQWNMIVKGLSGQSADLSYNENNDITVSSLNTKIEAAGGTGLQSDRYWSSTEYDINSALAFGASFWGVWYYFKDTNRYVRACLAF